MPSTRYRAGIIGCGRIAGKLEDDPLREHPCTHAGIYSSSSKIELAACCCPDINRAAEFADKWKMPAWYVSSEEMFAKEKLDIVSICTPASFHADMTIQAAQAGVKAVFCEKPMALSLEEADRMLECCHKNRVLLTINHL
ncbi:MAG: Gfo/Idh/MocA family oxidoreductase, partial [Candidatus Aureabacteria bacterium]|nr:Gfo/Idh/MocA family oxidoreductase [Candidatus Auribacterota bacterium]